MMIDWAKTNQLRDDVGDDDFMEVVELFLEEVEEVLDQLGGAGRDAVQDAHFLKGGALNLGFASFSELCAAAEASGVLDVAAIRASYVASKQTFLHGLQGRLAS